MRTELTNTRNTPIEALERSFPLRVLRQRLRSGSGGAGSHAGGEGIERDLQVLEDCTVSLITERRVSSPPGLWGGSPGAVGENWLLPGADEGRAQRLADKCTIRMKSGDVLRMLTPGGGGWAAAEGQVPRTDHRRVTSGPQPGAQITPILCGRPGGACGRIDASHRAHAPGRDRRRPVGACPVTGERQRVRGAEVSDEARGAGGPAPASVASGVRGGRRRPRPGWPRRG